MLHFPFAELWWGWEIKVAQFWELCSGGTGYSTGLPYWLGNPCFPFKKSMLPFSQKAKAKNDYDEFVLNCAVLLRENHMWIGDSFYVFFLYSAFPPRSSSQKGFLLPPHTYLLIPFPMTWAFAVHSFKHWVMVCFVHCYIPSTWNLTGPWKPATNRNWITKYMNNKWMDCL